MSTTGWFTRHRDEELDEELQGHLRMAIADRVDRGEAPDEATSAARREFGNVGLVREVTRDMWGWGWLERLVRDVRYAFRGLLRSRVYACAAIATLALGIGASTAIFSILDSLLLRALPVHDPARLVLASEGPSRTAFSYPVWDEIHRQMKGVAAFAAWSATRFDVARTGQTDMVDGLWVSGEFFDVLGVPAVFGRTVCDGDDRRGSGPDGPVAVISYAFWQRRYGGAADVVGKTLTLNRVKSPFRIIGVTAARFFGPVVGRHFDVAIPFGTEPLWRIVGPALVVAQVGLSVALVVAAGLFVRSFTALATLDLGFDTDRVLAVSVGGRPGTIAPDTLLTIFDRARESAGAVPGVERASYAAIVPVTGSGSMRELEVPGAPPLSGNDRWVYVNFVSPEWFATFGTPVLAGRDFTARDRTGAPAVVIVNQTFARRMLGNRSPLGMSIRFVDGEEVQADIVGLVRDAIYSDLRETVPPTVYIPIAQQLGEIRHDVSILVRSAHGSPAVLTRGVVEAIGRVDPTLLLSVRTVRDQVDAALTRERLMAMLAAFFGVLALLLAAIGVFGVTAYGVNRRHAEIGLRMALGASQAGVVRLVLGRALVLVALGLVAGGAASFWASRLVKALLFGIEPRDPVTFAGAAVVLAVVGLLAAAVPAWRASRIDPTTVMRTL